MDEGYEDEELAESENVCNDGTASMEVRPGLQYLLYQPVSDRAGYIGEMFGPKLQMESLPSGGTLVSPSCFFSGLPSFS